MRARTLAVWLVVALSGALGCMPGEAPPNLAAGVPSASGGASASAAAAPTPAVAVAVAAAPVAEAAPAIPASAAFEQARVRLLDGDYPRAFQEFTLVQYTYPGTPEATEALLRQGEAALEDEDFGAAVENLRRFLELYPDHPQRGVATLLLGRALEGKGDGGAAVAAYQQYEAWAEPSASLADVVHLRAAAIYFAAGRAADGWTELGQAVGAADQLPSASARARAYEALGARAAEANLRPQAATAINAALEAMVEARRPARSLAEVAWRLVGAYQAIGRRDLADALRWRIIGEWPRTVQALQAMNDVGATSVPAFYRGVISYANRRWQPAVEAFTFYLDAGAPEGQADLARYDRAVALARLGNDGALAALDQVAERHPESEWAPEALWEAGSLLLRQGNRPAAAARFERLGVGYPLSSRRSQALYWLGKLLPELGNPGAGRRYTEAAAISGDEDFYTFRARAALRRAVPAPKPLDPQRQITADERAAFEQWLAAHSLSSPSQGGPAARRAQVEQDARFKRGTVLLEAGFRKEAEAEFLELLAAFDNDTIAVEHVAVHVRDRGLYPLSVTLGHRLLDRLHAAGEPSLLAAPRVVQKLVLPLAFLGLVEPAARAKNVDPLLLLGLMKQESWFEPRAASSASARGLTQFIRETATTVAAELKWPNWKWDDMNRPYVSVSFGAHYLASLIGDFRGNYYFALAGYNGGPGNVLRWAKGDWNRDLDLFIEEIGFAETRAYVKAVAGNYELYKAIYSQ